MGGRDGRKDGRARQRLQLPWLPLARDRAVLEILAWISNLELGAEIHTSIGWQASPRRRTRPEACTHVSSGFRSMRRHFSVDFTCPSNLRILRCGEDVVS